MKATPDRGPRVEKLWECFVAAGGNSVRAAPLTPSRERPTRLKFAKTDVTGDTGLARGLEEP